MVTGDSTDYGHPHGLQCQHRPLTSILSSVTAWAGDTIRAFSTAWARTLTWPQVAQFTHIKNALGRSIAYKHHDFRQQDRPQTSTQPSVVAWAKDINTDPDCNKTIDPNMALSIKHKHLHDLQSNTLFSKCLLFIDLCDYMGADVQRQVCGVSWSWGYRRL